MAEIRGSKLIISQKETCANLFSGISSKKRRLRSTTPGDLSTVALVILGRVD